MDPIYTTGITNGQESYCEKSKGLFLGVFMATCLGQDQAN